MRINTYMPIIKPITLKKNILNGVWDFQFIKTNINSIKNTYKLSNNNINDDDLTYCVMYIIKNNLIFNKYKKYINECLDFNRERFHEYIEKRGKIPNASLEFYNIKYGKYGFEKFESYKKSINAWDVERYSIKKNISIEEAKIEIKNTLNNKSTTLDGFIKRYGEDAGNKKYNEWLEKCDQSLNGYIKRYGENLGKIKYEENIKKLKIKNPRCEEFWIDNGYTKEESILKVSEFQLNNSGCHKQYWINKIGEKEADDKIKKINRYKDGSSLQYFIKKYGNTEEAYVKYDISCKNKDCVSIKSFLNRGYNYEESKLLHKEAVEKRLSKINGVSLESKNFFDKLLKELNINFDKINRDVNEYYLYDKTKMKFYLYDLALFKSDKKCIIEYHGTAFHPSLHLTIEEFKEWKSPYSKESAEIVRQKDIDKKAFAIHNGFLYHEVWSDNPNNMEECMNFINKNFNYENKEDSKN